MVRRRHEIPTAEGKLFLDSVLDMGSRRIVGFALGEHHDAELAYAALAMAVAVRGGAEAVAGVIFHTDQGSDYTAGSCRAACTRLGITQSMGRVGSALDNAVIESWHSTLEFELRRLEQFPARPPPAPRWPPGSRTTTATDGTPRSAWPPRSTTSARCASVPSSRRSRRHDRPARNAPATWRRPRRGQGHALRVARGQP